MSVGSVKEHYSADVSCVALDGRRLQRAAGVRAVVLERLVQRITTWHDDAAMRAHREALCITSASASKVRWKVLLLQHSDMSLVSR